MIINNKEVKKNFTKSELKKMDKCMKLYNSLEEYEKIELNNMLSEEGRDFIRFYLLPNTMIAKYKNHKYDNIRDVRNCPTMALTFLVNEVLEAMTLLDFQKKGYSLIYNEAATRTNSKGKANSNADFVLKYNNEEILVELQTYMKEKDSFRIKQTKHVSLMQKVLKGKKVILLNKYITNDEVYYTYIDYNKVIDEDLYSYVTDNKTLFGGKVCIEVKAPEVKIMENLCVAF